MKRSKRPHNDELINECFTTEAQHDQIIVDLCKTMRQCDRMRSSNRHGTQAPYNTPSDVPGLDRVIRIDWKAMTAKVEANMTMEALVQAMLPLGCLPSVVAGSRSTTVADAFAALTSGSSSFTSGSFDCTVTEIEVILGNGQVIHARPGEALTEDLFYGSAGALNSLGLTTAFEISLVRAGPYVELKFQPTVERCNPETDDPYPVVSPLVEIAASDSDAVRAFEGDAIRALEAAQTVQSHTFVEAILFHKVSGVVVTGAFSPVASRCTLHESNDFLQLVHTVWRTRTGARISMPTESYLFRNTDCFILQRSCNEVPAVLCKEKVEAPEHVESMTFQSYGLKQHWASDFLQMINAAPVWFRAVLTPGDVGRRLTMGVGCPFDYEISFFESKRVREERMEEFLLKDHQNNDGELRGFPYLHCRVPCPPKTAWILHNDRWHIEPWLFHDDRWYVDLRLRWKSESIADVTERVSACPHSFPSIARVAKDHNSM